MKVQCKHIAINKKFCGSFRQCVYTTLAIKNRKDTFTFTADCRNTIEIDWVQYILYKDQVVVVEE